jgi:hypothetical protein
MGEYIASFSLLVDLFSLFSLPLDSKEEDDDDWSMRKRGLLGERKILIGRQRPGPEEGRGGPLSRSLSLALSVSARQGRGR